MLIGSFSGINYEYSSDLNQISGLKNKPQLDLSAQQMWNSCRKPKYYHNNVLLTDIISYSFG